MIPKVYFATILINDNEKASFPLIINIGPFFIFRQTWKSKPNPITDIWDDFANVKSELAIVNIKVFLSQTKVMPCNNVKIYHIRWYLKQCGGLSKASDLSFFFRN
jgi:hypothetical protein